MLQCQCLWAALLVGVLVVGVQTPVASADIGPFSVPDFTLTNGGFQFQPILGVPAGQVIYGLRLEADWTGLSGDPRSDELRLFTLPPGGGATSGLPYGGDGSGGAYGFGLSRYLAIPHGVASGGNWTLAFANPSIVTSAARLENVEVTLLENAVISYGGDTSGGPSWVRPTSGFAGLSFLGESRFDVQSFTVDTSGRYDIFSDQAFDGFVFLYAGLFDPGNPLVGGLAENDDGRTGEGTSDAFLDVNGMPLELSAGVTYHLVTTGYTPGDLGAFTNFIGGVGAVTLVPEPSSLLGLGLMSVTLVRSRRR